MEFECQLLKNKVVLVSLSSKAATGMRTTNRPGVPGPTGQVLKGQGSQPAPLASTVSELQHTPGDTQT